MARRKRNSNTLTHAERRIESLQSLNTTLDFGHGLTLAAYSSMIHDLRSKLAAYNTALSAIDKMADDVSTIEKAVLELSEKMLLGVGSRYGRNSQEYQMAGGSRRKTTRRAATVATPTTDAPLAPAIAASNGAAANGSSIAV